MVDTIMVPVGNIASSDYFHLHVSSDLAHGLSQSFSIAWIASVSPGYSQADLLFPVELSLLGKISVTLQFVAQVWP